MPRFFETKLRRHSKLMQDVAYSWASPFEQNDEFGLYQLLKDFKIFRKGHSRKVFNIISSKNEEKSTHLFDFRFVISGGNSHIPYYQTIYFIQSNQLSLPHFRLIPRKFYHTFMEWIGLKDDLDYVEEPIEKSYRIHTDAVELFNINFNKDVRHFLAMHPDWTVEGMGYYLIVYKKAKLLKKEEIHELKTYASNLFELIKNKAPFERL